MDEHQRKLYIVNTKILAQLEELIASLQCIFLEIYSNHELPIDPE